MIQKPPILDYDSYVEIIFSCLKENPLVLIPIQVPEFLYKIKHELIPEYFLYSLVAFGYEYLFPDNEINPIRSIDFWGEWDNSMYDSSSKKRKLFSKKTPKETHYPIYSRECYAEAAYQLITNEKNNNSPEFIWAGCIISMHFWNTVSRKKFHRVMDVVSRYID
ncbi:hypothetical protein AYI70_g3237 [Smittium culicis]|uniref:Uncharacterized protein n=1 Tax=Smittium culicis TaxID=133412 RepID=A0A1R1Y4L3_9FUNG|nr:hypothetical protein AYI70_g3237 [Smittium culicis]